MADAKISALTGATTPLAGTEVLPIVQSGTTKKVSVADLTAGRVVSASSLLINVANNLTPSGASSKANILGTGTAASDACLGIALPNATSGAVLVSNSVTSAGTGWFHYIGQSGNGSAITTNNIFIYGNGNIQNANNSYGAISDVKLKANITDATPKLEKLNKIRVVNYSLRGDYEQHKQIGVIAQELEQIFPGMVDESPDRDMDGNDLGTTTKSVKYSVFVPMLIKAVQELTIRVQTLEEAQA
jgi:hypothetical protein